MDAQLETPLSTKIPLPPPQRRQLARAVAAADPAPRRILVIRSRVGRTARVLAETCSGAEVVGVDPSSARVATARRLASRKGLANLEFVQSELEVLPFDDGSFDAAVVMLGLHEMSDDVRRAVLAEALRVLASGGRFYILEPDRPAAPALGFLADLWFRYLEEEWARRLFGDGLAEELSAAGFVIERKQALGGGFFQLVIARGSSELGR